MVNRLAGWMMIGKLDDGRLVGQLDGWLVVQLTGLLVGWMCV